MKLSSALEEKKMDLRIRDKLVHESKLKAKEVENYLSSLPDDTANLTWADAKTRESKQDSSTPEDS